jgi:hypothetical protein
VHFDSEDSILTLRRRRLHVTSEERKSKAEVMRKEKCGLCTKTDKLEIYFRELARMYKHITQPWLAEHLASH